MCTASQEKESGEKKNGGRWAGELDEMPNASAGRHKGRICLLPSHACLFFSLSKVWKSEIELLWLEDCADWRAWIKDRQAMFDVTQASS